MNDIIQLLPDSIANQIAAGEVVQRPASVIKELLENSIDAGSTKIKVILKNAGKTLIQVVDDGKGMSYSDARMCFERHATSKIKNADDLFKLDTLGFRGEALASIAAVSHVELKTQRPHEELGSSIKLNGSKIISHEKGKHPVGTSISVKNLFFNLPARRKFLKNDSVELKHIIDEFIRIALVNYGLFFSFFHNNNELFHLAPSNLRMRINNIFGKNINEKIVPVSESTDFVRISGFVGKPEHTKKRRGDQFLFVNNRFVKSNYINHAVRMAYETLISKEQFTFFVLLLDVPVDTIDINIHPTKQEIKFENERLIYNYIRVGIKHALGKYSIAPSLDFDQQNSAIFKTDNTPQKHLNPTPIPASTKPIPNGDWRELYKGLKSKEENPTPEIKPQELGLENKVEIRDVFYFSSGYIVCFVNNELIIANQKACHERVVYEKSLESIKKGKNFYQRSLFPEKITLDSIDQVILKNLLPEFSKLGIIIKNPQPDKFIIQGVPLGLNTSAKELILEIIDQFSNINQLPDRLETYELLAKSIAKQSSVAKNQYLSNDEAVELIHQLFECEQPNLSPFGKKCFVSFTINNLNELFN